MKTLARLIAGLLGFVLGAISAIFLVDAYVNATYSRQPTPSDPCDAGAYVGMGLAMLLAPILGFAFAAVAVWLTVRYQLRRAA